MSLLEARGIELCFGDRLILRGCDLKIDEGERIGLVGPNGCGKSSLLRVLAGAVPPDHGEVRCRGSIAMLEQDPTLAGETVGEVLEGAIAWHRDLVRGYQRALEEGDMARVGALQERLDMTGWDLGHQVDAMLQRVGAPPREARIARLSGGERRRVALARTLLGQPDLLLLDEPTNHLDVDAAEWLQAFLAGYRGAVLLVSHDRYLNEAVAERIVEVEDGVCVSYEGSYGDYLVARAERQAALGRAEDVRLAMITREAAWAARSPAARTTKSRSRLQRLEALQATRPLLKQRDLILDLSTGERLAHVLLYAEQIGMALGGRRLFHDLGFELARGERLGVLGPNGCGKSTLLRILAEHLQPDTGQVRRGPRVRAAFFDQERRGLVERDTVFQSAGGGPDHVRIGERLVHVASFMERFLFSREMLDQPVSALSGGERARLLLARLLLQGCNLLLLDEPTNDLDLQTLRVLEEALLGFDGAAVVVTHDRAFLDRVCTGLLAFEDDGHVQRYASRPPARAAAQARAAELAARAEEATRTLSTSTPPPPPARRRLSFAERRELEALPARIEALEAEQQALEARLADPATYRDPNADPGALSRRLAEIGPEAEALYARWEELEGKA
ncbi:MAG: ABC-F family ATP-binding cassette domain-containing protein [Pseudomonadota bacterium]